MRNGSIGYSRVRFSLPDKRVTEWDNNDGNLKVQLLPETSESSTPGIFHPRFFPG